MTNFDKFCQLYGLHPFVGFGMFAIDMMLFGSESATLGVSWPISVAIAVALTIPCILLQKYGMKEEWGLAIGKSLMIGVLTAIPTPLPLAILIIRGALGTKALLSSGKNASGDEKNK